MKLDFERLLHRISVCATQGLSFILFTPLPIFFNNFATFSVLTFLSCLPPWPLPSTFLLVVDCSLYLTIPFLTHELGPDGLSILFLINCKKYIPSSLCIIFNRSRRMYFLSSLERALIILIFKSGDPTLRAIVLPSSPLVREIRQPL